MSDILTDLIPWIRNCTSKRILWILKTEDIALKKQVTILKKEYLSLFGYIYGVYIHIYYLCLCLYLCLSLHWIHTFWNAKVNTLLVVTDHHNIELNFRQIIGTIYFVITKIKPISCAICAQLCSIVLCLFPVAPHSSPVSTIYS